MTKPVTRLLPAAALGLATALTGSVAMAETIDRASPDGFVQVNRKIQCSMNDEEAVTYTWSGRAWSRVPGERDRNLARSQAADRSGSRSRDFGLSLLKRSPSLTP